MTLAADREIRKRPAPRGRLVHPQAADLLAWYDRHRRELPWRAAPGETVDPYRVWLSEIMLQQTTVKTVGPYFMRFTQQWPDVRSLAEAPLQDVLSLGSEARMNYPGRPEGNWCWRFKPEQLNGGILDRIAELTRLYAREGEPGA